MIVLLVFNCSLPALVAVRNQDAMTNRDVIELVKAGVGCEVIVGMIRRARANFDLSTGAIVQLKAAGVSDDVLAAMLNPAATETSPNGPASTQADVTAAPQSPSPASALPPSSPAAPAQFDDAEYLLKAPGQEKAQPVKGTLTFDQGAKTIRFLGNGVTQLDIPYSTISGILYERAARPRYGLGILIAWPLLFTKSKKHFLTVQHKLPQGQGEFAIIRLDKKNYQMALATAEAQTGIRIERTEER
jgi:hypothetical protein